MTERAFIDVMRRKGVPWLHRRYYPAPHSDMQMIGTPIIRLHDCEIEFNHGRFVQYRPESYSHSVQVWFDHEDEEKRQHDIAQAIGWIATSNAPWSMIFTAHERIAVEFSFDDPVIAFMFMLEYGGEQQ
jgi:hypothetical protein